MRLINSLVVSTLVSLVAAAPAAHAEEKKAEEAAAEAPAEESKEGETTEAPKATKPRNDFAQRTSKLNSLEARMREANQTVEKLIREKNKAKDLETKRIKIEELKEAHKNLNRQISDYNQLRTELKYRYPEKDDQTERKYLPIRNRTLDEIEREMGVDASLTKLKKSVDQKYRPFTKDLQEEREARAMRTKVRQKQLQHAAGAAEPERTSADGEPSKKLRLEK